MALNFEYNYAYIDPTTNMCLEVKSSSAPLTTGITPAGEICVEIPVNDPEYCCKYYINGNWYEDPDGLIPWESSLL